MIEAQPVRQVEDAFGALLVAAEGTLREGTAETPLRAARAWRELMGGYDVDVAGLFTSFDADGYDEMVAVRDIPWYSTCEHHCEAMIGMAHVAYIPDGRIVGLSKLARCVEAYARRLQVQERLTVQVADAIDYHLGPKGVAVVLSARHLCMERRGVQKPGATTITSALRGAMLEKPEARAEAMALLKPC